MSEIGAGQLALGEIRLGQFAALPAGVVQVAAFELRLQQVRRLEHGLAGAAACPLRAFKARTEKRRLGQDAALEHPMVQYHPRQIGPTQIHPNQP